MNAYRQLDIETIKILLNELKTDDSQPQYTAMDGRNPIDSFAAIFSPISNLQSTLNGHLIENLSYYIREYNVEERSFNDINSGIFMVDRPPFGAINMHILTQELRIKQIQLLSLLYQLI